MGLWGDHYYSGYNDGPSLLGRVVKVGLVAGALAGMAYCSNSCYKSCKESNKVHEARVAEMPSFPRENVYTITATEYVTLNKRSLSDYNVQGVYVCENNSLYGVPFEKVLGTGLPKGTEAVVGAQQIIDGTTKCVRGTALVPKKPLKEALE